MRSLWYCHFLTSSVCPVTLPQSSYLDLFAFSNITIVTTLLYHDMDEFIQHKLCNQVLNLLVSEWYFLHREFCDSDFKPALECLYIVFIMHVEIRKHKYFRAPKTALAISNIQMTQRCYTYHHVHITVDRTLNNLLPSKFNWMSNHAVIFTYSRFRQWR